MEKRKLEEVFKTVGLPPYTYVKPSYFGEVRADITQVGKHLLIEGPSGVGKTCIVYKVFEELGWARATNYEYISCRDPGAAEFITQFIGTAVRGVFSCPVLVVDDFHILPPEKRTEIGSSLKRLSDAVFERQAPPKVILIGIPTSGGSLVSSAYDLGPRLGIYRIERAQDAEIDRLISDGETALNVLFNDREIILSESTGNFWLAQYICNKICASQEIYATQDDVRLVNFDLITIRKRLMDELKTRFLPVAKTFSKGKKWRPGGNKPYLEVLVALSKIPELVVPFDEVLGVVPERRRPGIKAVRPRISEVIYEPSKGTDLRRQIAFEPEAGFSIEDPLFRYFLTNLSIEDLYRELGIGKDAIERAKIYSYDVGFSFAGEVRKIVEIVNDELKKEDIVTFYDFDLQAFLLAMDLEATLSRIYTESCRYYLVFMDKNYAEKVWTRYEKDIMTTSGRSKHIIPVVLDDEGKRGVLGIPKATGRIDLSDLWKELFPSGPVTEDIRSAIRNRVVLPLTEKIDAAFEDV